MIAIALPFRKLIKVAIKIPKTTGKAVSINMNLLSTGFLYPKNNKIVHPSIRDAAIMNKE